MAQKIDIPMPPGLVIGDGWTIEFAAVNTTSGAAVSGVNVSNVNVGANDVSAGGGTTSEVVGPYMLVPGPGA